MSYHRRFNLNFDNGDFLSQQTVDDVKKILSVKFPDSPGYVGTVMDFLASIGMGDYAILKRTIVITRVDEGVEM